MTLMEWQVSRQPRSKWRRRARAAIEEVVRSLTPSGPHPSPSELLKLVDAAYPFGERKYEPYKCWLRERNLFREAISSAPMLPSKDEADVCEVARDMVEAADDPIPVDALRKVYALLEQAPNREARACPACGARARLRCREGTRSLLVPHVARLVGHLDAGPLFTRP